VDFNSVLIGSEDPAQLVAYYTKLFGEPAFTDGGYSGWQIGSGWITIGPHSEVKGRSREPGRMILNLVTVGMITSHFVKIRLSTSLPLIFSTFLPGPTSNPPNGSCCTAPSPS